MAALKGLYMNKTDDISKAGPVGKTAKILKILGLYSEKLLVKIIFLSLAVITVLLYFLVYSVTLLRPAVDMAQDQRQYHFCRRRPCCTDSDKTAPPDFFCYYHGGFRHNGLAAVYSADQ